MEVQGRTFGRSQRPPTNLPPGNKNVIHSNRRTLALLTLSPLALAMAMSASAANRTDLHNQNISLLNSQYKAAAAQAGALAKPEDRHAAMLGLDAESRLQVLTHNQDADGTQHYRYQQLFRGVPVWGESVVVSEATWFDVNAPTCELLRLLT